MSVERKTKMNVTVNHNKSEGKSLKGYEQRVHYKKTLKTVRPSGILKTKKQKTMNKYQDKEASMDDYSHERKLRIDGRYEAAKGKMAAAENDFDHAHALKKRCTL